MAVRRTPPHAARASAPPTEMRRTPSPSRSLDGEIAGEADQHVDGFGRHRLHHRLDLLARRDARRIEAVGARRRVGLQPADRLAEIGPVADQPLAAPGQHHIAAGLVDRRPRRLHPRHRQVEVVERVVLVAGVVLDRQPRHAGRHAQPHALRHALGRIGIAALEVGVHRHVDRRRQLGAVGKHHLPRHAAVAKPARPGEPRARRRQRLEAQPLQVARAAHVPRVGHHEQAALVQPLESGALLRDGRHFTSSLARPGRRRRGWVEKSRR